MHAIFAHEFPRLTMLDIACHCGVFTLEFAARGAGSVLGIDIREKNIRQAAFLKQLYDVRNARFEIGDAEFLPDSQFDVVLNFGIWYHTTFPMQLLQRCYDHCRYATVLDSNNYNSPIPAFYLVANKNTASTVEGKSHMELLPTYEAMVLAMQAIGFRHVVELVMRNPQGVPLFETHHRRVLIGFKELPHSMRGV